MMARGAGGTSYLNELKGLIDRSITEIVIPDVITSIGNYTFNSCTSLASVTIPSSVTSIGNSAFQSVVVFKILRDIPPTISENTFAQSKIQSIYVPDASVDVYKAATNWSAFASKIHPLSEYVEP